MTAPVSAQHAEAGTSAPAQTGESARGTGAGAPPSAAPAAATTPAGTRAAILAALGLWLVVGLVLVGFMLFGGYDGRPLESIRDARLTSHAVTGPLLLFWTAISVMVVPRAIRKAFS